jgi:acyl transferase domain-containing protein
MYQSLHCSKPNQLIDLLNSPFYLLDRSRKWDRPIIDGLEVPRRAGLSSFGAGGANAHLVLEEYRAPQNNYVGYSSNMNKPYIVPLSARTESALNKVVKNLQVHLTGFDEISDDQLADIAFTLQVGRDSMRYRLAFIVQDGFDLMSQLNAYLDGDTSQALEGVVNRKTSGIKEIAGTAREVASQWVLGEPIQWPSLSLLGERKRIWLPTYPFEGKRFWLEQEGQPDEVSQPLSHQGHAPWSDSDVVVVIFGQVRPNMMTIHDEGAARLRRQGEAGAMATLPVRAR